MLSISSTFDVLVVGAGAAGLCAAATIVQSGRSVCILEARDRLGGRIYARHEPGLYVPVELGAEFIHGLAPITVEWLRRGSAAAIDAPKSRWMHRAGRLVPAQDEFARMKRGLARFAPPAKDLPFSEFLAGPARRALPTRTREFARTLVEGYDAADATRVSTLATLDEWSGGGGADAATFRPQGGYSMLIDALVGALDPRKVKLQLNTIVHEVRWRRGRVSVDATQEGRLLTITAKRAVIALPLGVLQRSSQLPRAVRFEPALASKHKALAGLAVGPVIKILLRFRTAFWEELDDGRYRDAAFIHSAGAAFPTFWTSLPVRTSLLVAWAAGPCAAALSGKAEAEMVHIVLDCLETIFGRRLKVRAQLEGAWLHDWQADPFACGAYSYVLAGGVGARKILAQPLQNTLFFAGEAADCEGEAATVAGALQSGRHAAMKLLAVS